MDKGSSVNWTDTKVSNGATYRYLVRPYCGKTLGPYKGSKTVYRLTRTSLSSAKNSASRKLSLAWKRNNRASGYQLQYATNSRFRSPKTVTVKSRQNGHADTLPPEKRQAVLCPCPVL